MHAAQSSAAFQGNRFIPLLHINSTDLTFSMVLISGLFAIRKRTSNVVSVRHSWLILLHEVLPHPAERQLYLPTHGNHCVAGHDAGGFYQYKFGQLGLWEYGAGHFREISILMHVLYSRTQLVQLDIENTNQHFYFEHPYFQVICKSAKLQNVHIYRKSVITFAQGCNTQWNRYEEPPSIWAVHNNIM